ncbi:MAG: caspase family protein [Opitutaceae bacterium]
MITPEKAQQAFEAARTVLQQSAASAGISAAERLAIKDALTELGARYHGQVYAEVGALTDQYRNFIGSMSTLAATLKEGKTRATALKRLEELITDGTSLLEARPRPGAGSRGGARALRRRGVVVRAGAEPLRILCVHGVGHQEKDPAFEGSWRDAITHGLTEWSLDRPFEIEFVAYDDLFAADPPSAFDVAQAVVKLGASGLIHSLGDLFHRQRGFGDIAESARWTAGMVVQWAENERLRAASRKRVLDHTQRFQPHVVLSHSLGTLLSYDAFARPENRAILNDRTFVTFGSQIGNAFVRSTLGGRIEPLPNAKQWYHLFNPHDNAFTASLRIPASNFEQVDAEFDVQGILDHDALQYLRHPNTLNIVWRALALPAPVSRKLARGDADSAVAIGRQATRARPAKLNTPRRRALLVGINDYPNPADRLEGCVNDVFLMSSLLQESGFEPDDIRVVLNERATAAGIVERLEWLLDGAEDGQERVFYYSGHGAQIPGYGVGEKVDSKDECLVAYDFDWTREHAVTDDQFFDLYSQLPYGARFLTIFDCCHSGGLTRDGAARVRGLTPPDDIRHRELKWDARQEMWVQRDFAEVNDKAVERRKKAAMFGVDGDVNRLGRSAQLRTNERKFERARKDFGHKGPFMPVIFQACQEKQYSYEYRHGVQSYGAFTYSLGLILRSYRGKRKRPSWTELIEAVGKKLSELRYDQKPCLICPTALKNQAVPWMGK